MCLPPATIPVHRHRPPPGGGGNTTRPGVPDHFPYATRPSRQWLFRPKDATAPVSSSTHVCVPPSAMSTIPGGGGE